MKKKLVYVSGGARSGKSTFARKLAEMAGDNLLFVATATAEDEEMKDRILAHQAERCEKWTTLEAPRQVGKTIAENPTSVSVVLIDCISMLASNLLLSLPENPAISDFMGLLDREFDEMMDAYTSGAADWILVSNEVGMGLVPPYALGRLFRDGLGWINQQFASKADEVYFLVSGIPIKIKG